MDRLRDRRESKRRKKHEEEGDARKKEKNESGTCAAVSLSFNPLGFFLPPFPTFSVLIDKLREGTGPRD